MTELDNTKVNESLDNQPQNVADTKSTAVADSNTDTADKKETPAKQVVSKKFHQETFTSSNGNEYLMTFPGMRKAAKLRNEADGVTELHQMFMEEILEGKYTYKTFDAVKDGVDRAKELTVIEDDGTEKTYHVSFQSIKQIDDMTDASSNNLGRPSDYLSDEYIFDNLVEEDVNFDYFDEHNGFAAITNAAMNLYSDLMQNSEFAEVMNAVNDFLNKMFR
ncbi:hypothetical protein M2S00_06670 [Apilactobacillus sp. TMW 2.2459]|uniref:hypothetical protein n=1 Tax=Apilactobacillus xinyiensis TaxID=2841032 RepID=UPI00200DA779|nr:hypothetical protein [Apilactobacillus xinyiensis]MCL0312787.1 hypothetical protein [Apilactobacillus xinyiensis]